MNHLKLGKNSLSLPFQVAMCLLFILLVSNSINAQRAQSVYVEAFGLGGLYSINYDTRFQENPENSGVGMRIGAEFFEGIALFPTQVNYLIGKNGKFLEIGVGATFVTGVVDFAYGTTGFVAVPTLKLGYRSQPIDRGFTWNIGIMSLTTAVHLWGGIGIGYAF